MKLPVLALFERSLRVEARSLLMCFARVALPVVILVSLSSVIAMARYGRFGAAGLDVFRSIAWLDFAFITLAGLSYFASSIAEEKEEMTLGLLRMTGLGPLAILMGKSTSRLVGAMLLLLVQFPFTLLAVTLGGIGNVQIVATYCTLLGYIFFLCNLALIWSVVFRQTKSAAIVTGVCLGLFLAAPSALGALLKEAAYSLRHNPAQGVWGVLISACETAAWASPISGLTQIFKTGVAVAPVNFQVVSNVVLGGACFLFAWAIFERCTREQKEQAPARGLAIRRTGPRARVPDAVIGATALTWKEVRFQAGGGWGIVVKTLVLGLLYGLVACFPTFFGEQFKWGYAGGSMIVLSLILLALGTAFDASRVFREEVQWKTLAALMILPVTVRELAYRKVAGYLFGLLPILGYLALGIAIWPSGFAQATHEMFQSGEALLFMSFALLQFVFFLHLVAYLSLVVKRGALPLALAIQYFGGVFLALPTARMAVALNRGSSVVPMFFLGALMTLALIVGMHFAIGWRLQRVAAEE